MSILATGIYYRLKGEQVFRGPFAEEEVLEWYRSGWFTSTTAFRFGDDDGVVTLGELCDKNGSACPFRSKKEQNETPADSSTDAQLRKMQEQIDTTNRLLQASVERCTKLEQIVSSVVERFLLFSGELTDVKEEWKSIRNTPLVTGASPSVTSSTTTLASAASSSSSLNLLMQLKDDMNALEHVLRGGKDHDEESRRCEKGGEEDRRGERGDRGGGDILADMLCMSSPRSISSRDGGGLRGGGGEAVKRTDSGVSTASSVALATRRTSSEEDEGDVTMMETVEDERASAVKPLLPYPLCPTTVHLPQLVLGPSQPAMAATAEFTTLTRRIVALETGLREATDRIEEMKAADISHALESIDRVSEEMSASQNEMKTQRALDIGSQLVLEDAVKALKKDRAEDQERLRDVERFMGRMMTGTETTDDLVSARAIRDELRAAKERDEFAELRLYGIDHKLAGHADELACTKERLATLEEAMTKMLTLDSFKAMLNDHADELSSQMRKTSDDVVDVATRVDRVEQTTSQMSVHLDELNSAVEDLLDDTQQSEYYEDEEEYYDEDEGEEEAGEHVDECTCSMCREGKTPKVISDLLNGHRGHFDQARIATRADLIDIRDALSVRRRRSSFIEDTRHYFGEGVHCDHCDVTIREGVSLLSHVSSERHAQSTCILKEDLRFWWNRIRNADE